MSPDDIPFFDIGEQVVVKIGETVGGEVRFCIAKVADIYLLLMVILLSIIKF